VRRYLLALIAALLPGLASAEAYRVQYRAAIHPESGIARVVITLQGTALPSRLVLSIDPARHLRLQSDDVLTPQGNRVEWRPAGQKSSLRYDFVVDAQRRNGGYDSRLTADWAILRSDKLIPPIAVTAPRGLRGAATLALDLPANWSSVAPYARAGDAPGIYAIDDPGRSLPRPKGWLILGHLASRQDVFAGIDVRVAAPAGEGHRLLDTLGFIGWVLPTITQIFPDFPTSLVIVTAGDPMWRGALSGTRSLYLHADRPLISGNRTSTLIHELLHVGKGIRGGDNADWIVEGLAEYYAVEILHRTGAISTRRYQEAITGLERWGQQAPSLFVSRSSGAVTARAATVMARLDEALRAASDGKASLDDVARALATTRGEVTLDTLRALFQHLANDAVDVDAIIRASRPVDLD